MNKCTYIYIYIYKCICYFPGASVFVHVYCWISTPVLCQKLRIGQASSIQYNFSVWDKSRHRIEIGDPIVGYKLKSMLRQRLIYIYIYIYIY